MIQIGEEENQLDSGSEEHDSDQGEEDDSVPATGPKAIIAAKSIDVEGAKKIVQHDSENEDEEEDECEQLSANGSASEDEHT